MSDNWNAGNAAEDSADYRGWLIGHFIDASHGPMRMTTDLEVKWGIHPAGDKRPAWTEDEERSTLVILVSGKFRVDLSTKKLGRSATYVVDDSSNPRAAG